MGGGRGQPGLVGLNTILFKKRYPRWFCCCCLFVCLFVFCLFVFCIPTCFRHVGKKPHIHNEDATKKRQQQQKKDERTDTGG